MAFDQFVVHTEEIIDIDYHAVCGCDEGMKMNMPVALYTTVIRHGLDLGNSELYKRSSCRTGNKSVCSIDTLSISQ